MTLAQLKAFFRTVIKPVPGGPPVGTVGSNRAAGVLAALDKLAEFVAAAVANILTTVDLLDLTGPQCDEVMALSYVNCDADPADSPAWSYPGMQFDALDPNTGGNYRYYCTRSTYVPGNPTTGVGPAWHRVEKL
jgi:hypothetical protein